ncbi:DUF2169 family type VI secretion system accessory protein [Roseateles depolymerans]|uniref:Putative exported protein n=1 Tax=Roseateles depolymerans TaxID=76731 RepID=A0A0U3MRR0_9BURK|nr:DUF2169 domain-containing protein [Roseateles depolymerans]ALV06986.1 Putative exported protein [Roseateles depolymerans]REG19967.1 hypothetical protein DES44_2473 [Roseateles depolymerans]
MWQVDNRTRYVADGAWHRDSEGAEVWVVAVKATYEVLPSGALRIARVQEPLRSGPEPFPGLVSPRWESDFGPRKAATDIVLTGHAYAPTGADGQPHPVDQLVAGFSVGPVHRRLRVWGDRHWSSNATNASPSRPTPFLRMPLVFERAFGGPGEVGGRLAANPVGLGWPGAAGSERSGLPNLEMDDHPIRGPRDQPEPAGVGVVASHWPWRSRYAGTHDDRWMQERYPLPPLDQDPRFFQIAPPAQQVPGYLRGGEPVSLFNLTPPGCAQEGRIDFRLPRLSLAFTTQFNQGPKERSRSVIHTVILDTDAPRLIVVHHMALPCHARVNDLRKTVVEEMARPLDRDASLANDEGAA